MPTWITAPLLPGPVPLSGTCYNFTISGLSASTIYNYRSYMIVCGVEYYGNIYQIATTSLSACPTATTGQAYLSTNPSTSIRVSGNCITNKGLPAIISEYGIIYTQNPSRSGTSIMCYENTPTCVCKKSLCDDAAMNPYFADYISYAICPLSANTTTYYRAFAKNATGSGYGTIKCIQTDPTPPKQINLCRISCTGTDGVSHSTSRQHAIYSTPAMSAGECYCLCLYIPLGLAVSLVGSGSFASVGVSCNGPQLCFVCLLNASCSNPNLSFVVKAGDAVLITQFTCVNALGCGGANACTCIGSVSSISGSFQRGTTCCKSCTWTG
jgi:hypothetical protein